MANVNKQMVSSDFPDDLLYQWASTMDDQDANIKENREEEQQLSQKLSQLSAFETDQREAEANFITSRNKRLSTDTSDIISKKMKIDVPKENDDDDDNAEGEFELKGQIPNYLSIKDDSNFQQFIQSILSKTANSFRMEDFQEIALLLRQIAIIDIEKSLWNTYLKSGTGQLEENQLSRTPSSMPFCVWPMELKLVMLEKENKKKQKQQNEITITNIDQIDSNTCFNYVHQTLSRFMDRQMKYQNQLYEKKAAMYNVFTLDIEERIIQFIEQHELVFTRKEYDSKMAIIKYNYQDQLLVLKYKQLEPREYQLHLFEHLTRLKQEKETSTYELLMLKQRVHYHFLLEPLNSLQLPLYWSTSSFSSIDKLTDEESRQNLRQHYKKIVEQTKSDMMSFYIAIASAKMYECQSKFNRNLHDIKPDERFSTEKINQSLSQAMVTILEERFKNIDERFEYLSNLKIRFLEQKKKTRH